MKKWTVVNSTDADENIINIYNYIADVLVEPFIALNQINRINDAIDSLNEMPGRYPLYQGNSCQKDLHRMNVDNYSVFYQIFPDEDLVFVNTVIYGKRDIDKVLDKL